MKVQTPPVLPPENYISPIKIITDGAIAFTHLAWVKDAEGKPSRAFVKVFPNDKPRGLFNEYTGSAIMSALGVPQPPTAIIPAPIYGQMHWAFVSFQPIPVSHGTPKEIYNLCDEWQTKQLIARLLSCHAYASMVAADQLCMNADRNLGNLVFTGAKDFVVIDHGEILGGSAWKMEDLLKPSEWVTSKGMEICSHYNPLPTSTKNAIYAAAEVVAESLNDGYNELHDTLLRANNTQEMSVVLKVIWDRSSCLVQWFRNELGLVL